jgi:hypothetical protein
MWFEHTRWVEAVVVFELFFFVSVTKIRWRLLSSGMSCCVVWVTGAVFLEERVVSSITFLFWRWSQYIHQKYWYVSIKIASHPRRLTTTKISTCTKIRCSVLFIHVLYNHAFNGMHFYSVLILIF